MTFRSHIAGLLALVLALAGVELAVARAAPAIDGQVVLCGGMEREVITLDVNGDPVRQSQLCPDALIAFFAEPPAEARPAPHPVHFAPVDLAFGTIRAAGIATHSPQARGPPRSI